MSSNAEDVPAIETEHLTKCFGRTLAVKGLALQVAPGSTFGLIGPNGAGKSTTIKMLMGVLKPTGGRARLLGRDVLAQSLEVRQHVGYVPEVHNVDRWMRVGHAVGFCRSLYDSWNDKTCRQMLDLFRLDPNQKVKHLSKGMKVKLSLVLAVSHEPQLLILDEPMAGLDPLAREEFLDGVLRTICDRGQTVLFSTHSLDDVQRLADTVGMLYEGKLLVHRKIDELLRSTKRLRATLRDGWRPTQVPDNTIWQRLQGREWLVTVGDFSPQAAQQLQSQDGVENVEVLDLGLEDLFKDFVRGQRAAS
ncbi:MAG: ABC transporter ATP-binding protein [Pirellulaceae bacterium]